MNWKVFFNRWRDHLRPATYKNFDHKLVAKTRAWFLPSWDQIKYIARFFSQMEKRIISGATIAIVVTAFVWLGIFIKTHISLVPKNGGEYIEAMIDQPKYINPVFASINDTDTDITTLVYSGLFKYSQQKLVPDIAVGYTISDDKKNYTITLRQDVKWSDDEPLSADDVIFTFDTIQNPEVGSPLIPSFQGVRVTKIDDHTVSFALKEAFAPFLNSLTVGIIPEHVWVDIPPSGMRIARNNLQPVGTGAWIFNKLIKDDIGNIQSYSLQRNDNYYRQIPYLKNLTFKFYSEFSQAVEALRGQNTDALSFVPKKFKDKITGKNLNLYSLQLPQYTALFFNSVQQPLLKDNDLRLALAEGINKNQIVNEALSQDGQVIDSPLLPGNIGYYPDIEKINYSIDDANTLLDKKWARIQPEEYFSARQATLLKEKQPEIDAAKKNPSSTPEMVSSTIAKITKDVDTTARAEMDSDQIFYRKDKTGNILSLNITTVDTPEYELTANLVAKMWKTLGVHTTVTVVGNRQITKESIKDRSYQILLYGEIVGSDPDLYPFWHSSQTSYPGLNLAMYSDRDADKILETARTTSNAEDRDKLYKQFQDILIKDLPAVFLYSPHYTYAINKKIKGVDTSNIFAPAERYDNIANWYTKTTWGWKW